MPIRLVELCAEPGGMWPVCSMLRGAGEALSAWCCAAVRGGVWPSKVPALGTTHWYTGRPLSHLGTNTCLTR